MEQNNQYTNNPYIGGNNEQLYPTLPTQQEPTENVPVYGQYTPNNQFQPKFNEGYGQYNQKGGNEYSGSFEQPQQQYNQGYGNQQQFNQGYGEQPNAPVIINPYQQTNENLVKSLIRNGSISMAYDEFRKHSVIVFTVNGNVYHYYARDGSWVAEQFPIKCTGDISTVYEKQRQSIAFFCKGEDGYLKYVYLKCDSGLIYSTYHWSVSDCFKAAGKVAGRVCAVYEPNRNHSACFFVGEDKRVHYFYVVNGTWQYQAFGSDVPCTGDLAACYDISKKSSTFAYESYGKLQLYYYEKNSWSRLGSDLFSHPVTGCISIVFEKYRYSTSVFYSTKDSKLVYYFVDSGKWNLKQNFDEPVLGDIKAIWNSDTQHVEVVYLSKGGIQQYYGVYSMISGYYWQKSLHPFDCCSNLDAVFQPNRKHIEFFFISPDSKRNYVYFNGSKFQLTTNEKALSWDKPHMVELK
eukprot:gene10981-3687_t